MMYAVIHDLILHWYYKHGRTDLPWRNTDDPYHVYISEMMLQQTQVSRVLEHFYFPFLERFPHLSTIARAGVSDLLHAWSGLGYYSRARNIHKLALIVQDKLPSSARELCKLPGIGRYSANAIACFAFKKCEAIVDANIKRVLSRFFALENPTESALFDMAWELLNKQDPFNHNQALLDIGALICKPKAPLCMACPLHTHCKGSSEPLRFSAPKRRLYEQRELYFLLHCTHRGIALQKSTKALYHGMLGFPEIEREELEALKAEYIGGIEHRYTKYKIRAHLYVAPLFSGNREDIFYISPSLIEKQPISSLTRKLFALASKTYLK